MFILWYDHGHMIKSMRCAGIRMAARVCCTAEVGQGRVVYEPGKPLLYFCHGGRRYGPCLRFWGCVVRFWALLFGVTSTTCCHGRRLQRRYKVLTVCSWSQASKLTSEVLMPQCEFRERALTSMSMDIFAWFAFFPT